VISSLDTKAGQHSSTPSPVDKFTLTERGKRSAMVNDDAFSSMLLGAGILVAVLVATFFIYYRMTKPSSDWTRELSSMKLFSRVDSQGSLKDIFEERRRTGNLSSRGKAESSDRPFGSTYYYAHNNPNATGGYKDGLRMEDYTMNQPRLLSKGSVPPESSKTNVGFEDLTVVLDTRKVIVPRDDSKRISKFLWDDPGDPDGVATIRIDTLPAGSETIAWRDANIREISATLVDNKKGLLVTLESEDGIKYRLHIPKLYGQVEEVRKVAKSSRLLVRLYKKKNRMNPWDKKNLEAWPHP
jgi:hypothetical protein